MEAGNSKEVIIEADKPSRLKLYLSVLAVYMLHLSTGQVVSWPSPVLPKLNLTDSEQSLVSSLYHLAATPGPLVLALGLDSIGRKSTLYVIWLMYMSSWVVLWSSQSVMVIYIGRIMSGLAFGASFGGVSVYIAEIADNETRPTLNSLVAVFLSLGYLVEYSIGPYVSYDHLAVVSMCVTAMFGIVFYNAPESPHFLMAKEKRNEAFNTLKILRGNMSDESINAELKEIEDSVNYGKETKSSVKQLLSRSVLKALGIGFFLFLIQQGSSVTGVLAYIQTIFQNVRLSIDHTTVPMLLAVVNLFGSLFLPLVVKLGVKAILVATTLGMGICLSLLGLYFFLLDHGNNGTYLEFLPILSVILLSVLFTIGPGALTWVVINDMFPSSVKGMTSAVCASFSGIIGFASIEAFILLLNGWGFSNTFLLFGSWLIFCSIVATFVIPDTSKMSFQEVQDYLEDKSWFK